MFEAKLARFRLVLFPGVFMNLSLRNFVLIGVTVAAVLAGVLLPAMAQPGAYHDFADKRAAYGVENFLDVVSNAAFAVAGVWVLWMVAGPKTCFERPGERVPYFLFAVGLMMTAAGSCYYHLKPNNETLFWDRLPMTIAFMSLISATVVDRVSARLGLWGLVPMLAVGVGSVVYWIVTERLGRGNVVPYAVVQGYAVVVLVMLITMYPSRYTHGWAIWWVLGAYVLAKVLEHYDREIFGLTGVVSGHTLKHVAAGLGGLPVGWMLWRRRVR
jgi:hypothetical protein